MRQIEVPQVRCRLVLAQRHQMAVGAAEVAFLANDDVVIGLGAEIFRPDRLALAIVIARHRPRPREGVVDGGDLGVQTIGVGRVEENALLDDRPVVLVQRQAIGVEIAWAPEVASLDIGPFNYLWAVKESSELAKAPRSEISTTVADSQDLSQEAMHASHGGQY